MKFKVLLAAILVAALWGGAVADDALKGTTKLVPSKVSKAAKSDLGPVDRELEIRVGPRATFVTGTLQKGVNGTSADIWDDLKFNGVRPGAMLDVDWQPIDRLHIDFGMTYDNYNQSGTTQKNIQINDKDTLLSGGTLRLNFDLFSFTGKVGYDLIKNKTYRLQPYIGGKGYVIENSTGSASGSVTMSGRAAVRTGTKDLTPWNQSYGMAFGGIDQRIYVSRDWYLGVDAGATGLSDWYFLTGQVYTGYDFSRSWGIRIGYAGDYLDYANSGKSTKVSPLVSSAYVQMVWGF